MPAPINNGESALSVRTKINTSFTDASSHFGSTNGHPVVSTTLSGFMSAADKVKLNGVAEGATANLGTVTSVALAVPTGLEATAAITTAGTITLSYATGYSIPTTVKQTQWDTAFGWGDHDNAGYITAAEVAAAIGVSVQAYSTNLDAWSAITTASKQDALVSGTNIKTINGQSILGAGNITIEGGSGGGSLAAGTLITASTVLTVVDHANRPHTPVSSATPVNIDMPATATNGDVFTIINLGAGSVTLRDNAGDALTGNALLPSTLDQYSVGEVWFTNGQFVRVA